jgi:hypothetical protein
MDESDSLQDHFLKIKDLREQLNAIGQKIEEDMVIIILKNLPPSF